MSRTVNPSSSFQSKLEQIRSGTTKKTDLGVKENKGIIQGKGGKYQVFEKEKKFEEAGVKKKKRNYVMYESKLGTERQKDLKKIDEPPKPKPKPKPVPKPRVEEKIIQKKKRLEYLDNYQYHETKEIKHPKPNRVSIVKHQRLGDIVGGVYEEMTYQKQRMTDSGRGQKVFSQQTTKTTSRRGPQGQPQKPTSRTLPAQSREYRKEINTRKNAPKEAPAGRTSRTTTTTTTTKTTTTRSSSRPNNPRTATTTTQKTVTRGQSAGSSRGRRH